MQDLIVSESRGLDSGCAWVCAHGLWADTDFRDLAYNGISTIYQKPSVQHDSTLSVLSSCSFRDG